MKNFIIREELDKEMIEMMEKYTGTFCAEEMLIGDDFEIIMKKDEIDFLHNQKKINANHYLDEELQRIIKEIYTEYFVEDDKCATLYLYGKVFGVGITDNLRYRRIVLTDIRYIYNTHDYWLSPKLKINFIERYNAEEYFTVPFIISSFDEVYNFDLSDNISKYDKDNIHGIVIKPYDLCILKNNKPIYMKKDQ